MLPRSSTIPPGLARMAGLALLLAGLAYPFAVYFGIEHLSPRLFAALLGALWLARLLSSARAASRAVARPMPEVAPVSTITCWRNGLRWGLAMVGVTPLSGYLPR